ncbi:MAG TPA: DMT family transporter [Pseudonocardiaceae bacterium]|jgi:drug/metabolite transporter (DMT)-like permease|nr:DMT family transporter [Pseudonocardiaceae bacterium]
MRSWSSLARFVTLALVWGSSFLWIKIALGGLAPTQIAAIRLTLGAAVIIVLCVLTKEKLPVSGRTWLRMIVPALFGAALPFTLFAVGERSVDSGVAGVLNSTTPLWALLITLVIGTERNLGVMRVGGLLLGFAGTLVIFAPWHAAGLASWGALACLLAAISYAISYAYIGRHLTGTISPVALTASQLSGGVVLAAVALPVTGGLAPVHISVGPVVAVAILGIAGTGIAIVLNNRLIADEGVTTATSVGYLLPVVSVLLGAVFLREQLNVRIVAGMVVVLVGVALSRRRPAQRGAAAETGRDTCGTRVVPVVRHGVVEAAWTDGPTGARGDGRGHAIPAQLLGPVEQRRTGRGATHRRPHDARGRGRAVPPR